jgi:hypothetical protein
VISMAQKRSISNDLMGRVKPASTSDKAVPSGRRVESTWFQGASGIGAGPALMKWLLYI